MPENFQSNVPVFGDDPPLSECPEPIAIVGMGCRWPGEIQTPSQLWDMLKEKRSGYSDFPKDKLNVDGFYHPNQHRPGSMYTRGGFFINEDTKQFDHSFFGITPLETMTLDPAQRKLLEVVYEAFELAGEPWEKISGSRTGVFVGNFNYDHQLMQFRDPDHPLPYVVTGGGITILSNRINYVFNLQGPSMTIDTACSSSMYALHLAVNAIRNGDCDQAIVAGSNFILGPEAQLFTTKLGAISPTSISHTFDESADGYARAEGVGALFLKRIPDALSGSYPLRAVVRGTSINANGRTGGISHPSPEGQEAVIRQAYHSAGGLDPKLTGYFECHGTGTQVGDPLEVSAIGRVFSKHCQDERLMIGSIKTNLGHSESASAIAGIMKAVLALEHGVIPPTIGLKNPNPKIDFDGARVKVVTDMTAWPSRPIRRVSINSFGYGGANAHCILDHPASVIPGYELPALPKLFARINPENTSNGHNGVLNGYSNGAHNDLANGHTNGHTNGRVLVSEVQQPDTVEKADAGSRRLVLLPFSANDKDSLKTNIMLLDKASKQYRTSDVVYTLSRRSKFSQRAFAVTSSGTDSFGYDSVDFDSMSYGKASSAQLQCLGFVFTGQGAQWTGMGAELFNEYAVFKSWIRYQDRVLQKLSNGPSWLIEDVLLDPPSSNRIQQPEFSQTVCTALQIALVQLLLSWGIFPTAVVGHSSGEIATAYAAGCHTAAEAISLAWFRGRVVATNTKQGRMLAVGLGPDDVPPYLTGRETEVKIAAVNSPDSVTLSGEIEAIESISEKLKADGIFNRALQTGGNAYHSHHMAVLGQNYEELATHGLSEVQGEIETEPQYPHSAQWVSSVNPDKNSFSPRSKDLGPSYWRKNLESPVLFSQAVEGMAQKHPNLDLLIEIGPHPALGGPLKQIRAKLDANNLKLPSCIGTLVRKEDGFKCMLNLAGNLFLKNYPLKLEAVNATDDITHGKLSLIHGNICVDLPTYSYHYGPNVFYENRWNKEWRNRKHLRHDLLGSRQPGGAKGRPVWRNMLRLKDVPWLDDHKLIPHPIFPAAGYLAMAIEAAYQLHLEDNNAPKIAGFTLRDVAINSTLQIPDDEFGVEVITNVQSESLTSSTVSHWYEFKISSVLAETENWTEHCSGSVKIETKVEEAKPLEQGNLQSRDTARWYKRFSQAGLGYGPAFQGLSNLTAHRQKRIATAAVEMNPTEGMMKGPESKYFLHPATLDTCLQLALIAGHGGQVEDFKSAYVPIHVDAMSIWCTNTEETTKGRGVASGELRGLRGMYAQSQLFSPSGKTIMDIKSFRCVSYDGSPSQEDDGLPRNPYLRLVWKPDINKLNQQCARILYPPVGDAKLLGPVFKELERLSAFVLIQESLDHREASKQPKSDHLKIFLNWVHRCYSAAEAGTLPFGREALAASPITRAKVIESISQEFDDIPEVKLVKRVYDNIEGIFSNETSGLQVALQDNLLTDLYVSGIGISSGYPQLQNLVDLVAHKMPRMRILEVGAGTGGATRLLMSTLRGKTGFKRYQDYTFTDVTTSFFAAAQNEFSACKDMTYKALDIEKDPLEQGFEEQAWDCIVASQVLHATTTISETLKNVRKLLRPGGKLILLELTRTHIATGLILGTFPDYWKGIEDGRGDSPLMDKAHWQSVLSANGFSGIDILLDDLPAGLETASSIIATAVEPEALLFSQPSIFPTVFLAGKDGPTTFVEVLAGELRTQSISPIYISLKQPNVPHGSRVISLVDTESPAAVFEHEHIFNGLKKITQVASSLLWVTANGVVGSNHPESGLMSGLLRTITTETPSLKLAYLDLEPEFGQAMIDAACNIVRLEQELQGIGEPNAVDRGYAMHKGCLQVSRLTPDERLNKRFNVESGLNGDYQHISLGHAGPLRVDFEKPGLLASMFFKSDRDMLDSLKEDCIEIKTQAMGLNIKDLAVATGRFDWNRFSTECSGIVHKVGSAVKHVRVGDRVYGAIPGNFGNFIRSPAMLVQKMDNQDKPEEMASLPVAYMTAVYALIHLAHLEKGESVLIQSATGGLGMASLRIARHLGAEIYATVGTPEKVNILVDEFGIARDHIFDSRAISACHDIMERTKGKGIDVILCSAAGEQMHEMWRCIAFMGRFIEVGRTDILGHGKLSLEVFKRNATFSSFDLGLIVQQKPSFIAQLMAEVDSLYRQGIVQPIDHIQTFDISQLEKAMMSFSRGTHTGKMVITFDESSIVKVAPSVPQASFDPNANYVLVGCLGGLGRSISTWMVERGARNLTYLSRSGASTSEARTLISDLEYRGVHTSVIQCDITSLTSVESAIAQAAIQLPIKGIIQAATIFADINFATLTFEQLQAVLGPKVTGTQNLHLASLTQPLDFFFLTSSIVSLIGTATQAAYSAANAYCDAFARFRCAQGLCGTSISLGLILDVGFAAQRDELQRSLNRNGVYGTSEAELIRLLEGAFVEAGQKGNGNVVGDGDDVDNQLWQTTDPLAAAHLLTGMEPTRIYGLDPEHRGRDYAWYDDARFGQVIQAIEDHAAHSRRGGDGGAAGGSAAGSVAQRLEAAGTEETALGVVIEAVVERLAKLLFLGADEIDATKAVSDYGMDSMIAAEMRNWLVKLFGVDVSFLELLSPEMKILGLAERALKAWREKQI